MEIVNNDLPKQTLHRSNLFGIGIGWNTSSTAVEPLLEVMDICYRLEVELALPHRVFGEATKGNIRNGQVGGIVRVASGVVGVSHV